MSWRYVCDQQVDFYTHTPHHTYRTTINGKPHTVHGVISLSDAANEEIVVILTSKLWHAKKVTAEII